MLQDGAMDMIPFTSLQFYFIIFISACNVAGLIANSIAICVLLFKIGVNNGETVLILNVVICDILVSLTAFIANSQNWGQTSSTQSFLFCQLSGAIVTISAAMAIYSLILVAMYYHHNIVKEKPPPKAAFVAISLVFVWIWLLSLPAMIMYCPFDLVDRFRLESIGLICSIDFSSRKPLSVVISAMASGCIVLTPFIVAALYVSVWKKIRWALGKSPAILQMGSKKSDRSASTEMDNHAGESIPTELEGIPRLSKLNKSTSKSTSPSVFMSLSKKAPLSMINSLNDHQVPVVEVTTTKTSKKAKSDQKNQADEILFRRGLLITITFMVLVMPMGIIWTIEMLTGTRSSPLANGFALSLLSVNQWANPIIILLLDPRYKAATKSLFFI